MKKFATLLIIQIIFTTSIAYSQGVWKMKGEKENLRALIIRDIEADSFGNIWFISTSMSNNYWGYLSQYTTSGEWLDFKSNEKIYKTKFSFLVAKESGSMLCYYKKSKFSYEFFKYDGSSWDLSPDWPEHDIRKNFNVSDEESIWKFSTDTLNRTWVETKKGLLLCENGAFIRYLDNIDFSSSDNSYNNGYVITNQAIFQFINDEFVKIKDIIKKESYSFKGVDYQNRAWFLKKYKSWTNSICYYHNNSWKDFEFEKYDDPDLNFQLNGTTWITNSRFIKYIKNDGIITNLFDDDEERSYFLAKMIFDDSNSVYFVFDGYGEGSFLIRYDGKQIHFYPNDNDLLKLKNTSIKDVIFDSKNNLWIIAGAKNFAGNKLTRNIGVIIKKSGDSFESFDKSNGFITEYYSAIIEDSLGRIWITSYDDGIFMYEYNE